MRSVQAELEVEHSTRKLRVNLRSNQSKFVVLYFKELARVLGSELARRGVKYRPRDRNDVLWMVDVDHHQPKSLGGPDALSNYVLMPSQANKQLSNEEPTPGSDKRILYGARD